MLMTLPETRKIRDSIRESLGEMKEAHGAQDVNEPGV
jgi:hypothetical protein